MKTFILLLLILKVLCEGILLSENPLEKTWSKAFVNVTRHLFQLETRMFINNYDVDSDTITSMILNNLNEKAMPFQLKNLQLDQDKIFLDSSALITFNNFALVKDFNQKLILNNEYFKPLQLFIFCQKVNIEEIESLKIDVTERSENNKITEKVSHSKKDYEDFEEADFNSYLLDIIQYEYFLVEEESYIKLFTFLWFSPGKCAELTLTEVNKFDKITENWENDQFSMKKSANLHGCTIVYEKEPIDPLGLTLLDGLRFNLSFQKFMNATFVGRSGKMRYDWLQSKGFFTADNNDRYRYTKNNDSFDINFITVPVDFTTSRLMGNEYPEYYSEYEKLLMPFDELTWIMIVIFFAAPFATILFLYFYVKKSTRDFVIGQNVTTPTLNVIQIFFGISQVVVPKRNFARFLTMMFLLYCLIIRTAWQGKMFEFMQKDIEKPGVDTIEEMIKLDYTFIMQNNFKEKFPDSEISKRGKITSVEQDFNGIALYATEITSAFFIFQLNVNPIYSHTFINEFITTLKKEEFAASMCGLKFPRHHPFFEIYDHKLQHFFTGKFWSKTYYGDIQWPRADLKRFRTIDDPKVLNMKMLEPGFVIWTSSLLLAVVAFIFEWLLTLKDFIVMKYILKAFYNSRRQNDQFKQLPSIETKSEQVTIYMISEK